MINSGAAVSVFTPYMPQVVNIPRTSYAQPFKSGKRVATLLVKDGTLIKTLGFKMVPLRLGNPMFQQNVIVLDVLVPCPDEPEGRQVRNLLQRQASLKKVLPGK